MKKICTKLMMFLAGVTLLSGLTSCLGENDSDMFYSGYCTISGSMDQGYVLYSDQGDELHPTSESVYAYCKTTTGFGTVRRAMMVFTYKQKNVKAKEDGNYIIYNMKVYHGEGIEVREPLSLSAADAQGVTSTDSIFDVYVGNIWLSKGYLNASWQGHYSKDANSNVIDPTLNLVYDDQKICADSINFSFYYNRHDSINTNDYYSTGSQVTSYDLVALVNSLPTSDSILICVMSPDSTIQRQMFARSDLQYPDK